MEIWKCLDCEKVFEEESAGKYSTPHCPDCDSENIREAQEDEL